MMVLDIQLDEKKPKINVIVNMNYQELKKLAKKLRLFK